MIIINRNGDGTTTLTLACNRCRTTDSVHFGDDDFVRAAAKGAAASRGWVEVLDGHVLLDQQGAAVGDARGPSRRGRRRGGVVGADHPSAPRQLRRLHDPRPAHVGLLVGIGDGRVPGLGHLTGGEGVTHGRLVAGSGHRRGRVVRKPEALPGLGGDDDPLVVDRDDGVDGAAGVERFDGPRRGVGVAEGYDDRPVAHRGCEHRRLVRRHHHLDPERPGGGDEIRGPVGGRWQQQESPRHGLMMATWPI